MGRLQKRHWAKLYHSVSTPFQVLFILEFFCVDTCIHQPVILPHAQEYASHYVCFHGLGANKPSYLWFSLAQLCYIFENANRIKEQLLDKLYKAHRQEVKK